MAIKFNVIQTKFFLDVAKATQNKMEDLIPVYGFIGEKWRNPDYLIIEIEKRFWFVSMEEVVERLQDSGGDANNLLDSQSHVWFVYAGNDRHFLQAVIDAAERGTLFKD